ncbi:UDP-N-acetylmuramate--L-alanine ligase [Ohtaekwangia koreensis]|uniref:UDP-N-acetylmuramate: L-alanyl-gamma-D-glutamyl-meso-diaminopimelate ligase n=1 Tax=Ohtaekwangia koreensis TaxID=688867 RepID=A0A1T5K9H3_9BACT|nr:Mur ligase family protein [Ohtaekwangia koreensis]SKC60346.1 UDP-N-acetylmuramate: L-alanyl-gamma-D-glutamyl-meso-diaminopimelate ligase [Ohtaekwangia koreensis]
MHTKKQRVHFIAIGGSVMHNLAIALKDAGHDVSGSDDEIFEPSRSTLTKHGLLPEKEGWRPDIITSSIDVIVLGMHARKDNPELLKAQQLGLKILSFPEYIFEQSHEKQRVVIAGSHGKTTTTAIIIHVLNYFKRDFDYVIGAKVPGIENTVKLSDAPIIIIEGDEYLCSALDPTPKFLKYQHHIGVITGISWDHVNVFPSEDEYVRQFDLFADQTPKSGILIYCEQDSLALMIGKKERADVLEISYKSHSHASDNTGHFFLTNGKERTPIKIFGSHNFQNLNAAKEVLKKIGISQEQFFEAISSFEGASGRLEKVLDNATATVYKDFAHAPSKVKATVKAMKEAHPSRDLVACLELHTYSSLNKKFLPHYKDSMKAAQTQVVYFNPDKVKDKNLEALLESDVRSAFASNHIQVFTKPDELQSFLEQQTWKNKNLLMMSSGNFGGINIRALSEKILS